MHIQLLWSFYRSLYPSSRGKWVSVALCSHRFPIWFLPCRPSFELTVLVEAVMVCTSSSLWLLTSHLKHGQAHGRLHHATATWLLQTWALQGPITKICLHFPYLQQCQSQISKGKKQNPALLKPSEQDAGQLLHLSFTPSHRIPVLSFDKDVLPGGSLFLLNSL